MAWTGQDWAVVIGATAAAIPASIAAVSALRNGRRANEAKEVAVKTKDELAEKIDTGNQKDIGRYVHDIASNQQTILALLHTNTREVTMLSENVVKLDHRIATHKHGEDDE